MILAFVSPSTMRLHCVNTAEWIRALFAVENPGNILCPVSLIYRMTEPADELMAVEFLGDISQVSYRSAIGLGLGLL